MLVVSTHLWNENPEKPIGGSVVTNPFMYGFCTINTLDTSQALIKNGVYTYFSLHDQSLHV
jgi:hypothetical protein